VSRPRNAVPMERFNVSLAQPVAEQVRRIAQAQRRSGPAVIASMVASAGLADVEDEAAEEARALASPVYRRLLAENEQLAAALTEASRQLAQQRRRTPAEVRETPRWAWPLDCLLADAEWWERWLPKLNQLMGSDGPGLGRAPTRDGYVDLMELVFPAIGVVTWRSLEYRAAADAIDSTDQDSRVCAGPGTSRAWEPVIRHVVRALAALESAEQPEADPYHAMRVQTELQGPWIGTLRNLLGRSPAELRDLPFPIAG